MGFSDRGEKEDDIDGSSAFADGHAGRDNAEAVGTGQGIFAFTDRFVRVDDL